MKRIEQIVRLTSNEKYGQAAPPRPLGEILRLLPVAVSRALRMSFEGRSTASGPIPGWLHRMSDIRLVEYTGKTDTRLHFACPTVGEAAPELFEQQEFGWTEKPHHDDTGFDILGDVVSDLTSHNADSERFDRPMLQYLAHFRRAINGTFQEIAFSGHRLSPQPPSVINESVIKTATEFSSETPRSEPARVVGKLDMIRASTQAFAIKLDSGDEVRGVMLNGDIGSLSQMLAKRVLVLGKAIYRPSGRLLRIDAENVQQTSENDTFFSKMPSPSRRRLDVRQIVREQSQKRGVAAIIGKWPGDETDDVIAEALQELS